ncbi:MAG: DUF1643 domain-containing protein [Rhizobiales bacterium]|nr:hypothetical protein [Hyphomicrobiales bacterium]NRB13607.1 DUF1643 domain-containing protein [Hyphomicrobiales bacterium]
MLTKFIAAAELKQQFAVFGNFYDRQITPKMSFSGRNLLEIIAHDICPLMPKDITAMLPCAIMVMMNPGSSRPLEAGSTSASLSHQADIDGDLVAAKPDTTQYQVMRVMHYMGWQHVRVINLSDIREAKSPLFIKKFHQLEADYNYDLHSIFAPKRTKELELALRRKPNAPILKGWGISDKLDLLIERAETALQLAAQNSGQIDRVFGVQKLDLTPIKYFHPLPTLQKRKNQWVENMVKQLKLAE